MGELRIGCSGWQYDDWRGRLYPASEPKRRWLELYAEHFDTVEVNATFYRLARRDAVAAGVRHTPAGFQFAVKASRYLTHVRRLADIEEGIARFYAPLAPLQEAGRLGPVLWQLPETFHRDDARLAGLLARLPPGRHAIEFRHASWFEPAVTESLREHDVAVVLGDHPDRPFQTHAAASWRFIRFHYGRRGRRGNYSATELEAWSRQIALWSAQGDVYAFFNNDWEGFAPANAASLRERLQSADRGAIDR